MGRIVKSRTRSAREIHVRESAARRLRETVFGPDHPIVEAGIRWQNLRKSADSAATSVCDFRAFFEFCHQRGIEPLDVTRLQAREFAAEQETLDYAPSTVLRRVVVLRSLYFDLEEAGVIDSNPFYRVKAGNKEPVTPTPALTAEQCDRLIEMAGATTRSGTGTIYQHRNAAMAYTMVRVGPRCMEVAGGTWGAIVPRGDGFEWRIHGKGNRWAGVVLPPDVIEVLADWRVRLEAALARPVRPTDALFPAIDPMPSSGVMKPRAAENLRAMDRRNVSRIFSGLLRDIDLSGPRYSSHAARATAATLGYAATKDVVAVQEMLRHRNQATTLGYIKAATTDSAASQWQPSANAPVRDRGSEERDVA
jgi:integrase